MGMFGTGYGSSFLRSGANAVGRRTGLGRGAAPPGLEAHEPEAGPPRLIGGRARRHRPETAALARHRARPLAAGLRWAALALPLGAFLCAAALSVSPAQAQTTFVSNTGESTLTSFPASVGDTTSGQQTHAQQFTTGTRILLKEVVVSVRDIQTGAVPKVSIYTSSGNNPGTSLYVLTNPSSFGSNNQTFTAPEDAELAANTNYFVVLEETSDKFYRLHTTSSDAQTGETGWSIANTRRSRTSDGGSWSSNSNTLKIAVRGEPTHATGAPAITGTARVGNKLTATIGTIADLDGLPSTFPGDYTFQWVRIDSSSNETEIDGATSHEYTLVRADEGHTIKVKVSFTDDEGNAEGPLVSAATSAVAAPPATYPSADALLSNLSRSHSANVTIGTFLADKFTQAIGFTTGSNPGGYELRSIRADMDGFDSGDGVRVRIFSSSGTAPGSNVARLRNPTAADGVREFTAPAGTILAKDTLYFVVFDSSNSSGRSGVSVTSSDTTNIAAAGWSLNTQRHQKDSDSADWETSASTPRIEINGSEVEAEPNATGKPSITGTAKVGQTLTATTSGISDSDGKPSNASDFTYQWVRVDADGSSNPTDIGTDSQTYTLVAADEGKKIKVKVSFTDNEGIPEGPLESDAYPAGTATVAPESPNNPPVFDDGTSATRSIQENLGAATDTSARNVGDPVAATDDDSGDTLTYGLSGTDAAKFDIDSSSGQIKTKVGRNYDHETNEGTLSVSVEVSDGTDTTSIPVTIEITDHPTAEPPLEPEAPIVQGSATDTLSVYWRSPDNRGRPAIAGYDVQYRQGTSGTWIDGPQDETGTSAPIGGLSQETSYQVRVRAKNADGNGPWSSARSGKTRAPGEEFTVLLDTTLTTASSSRQGYGCSSTSNHECADQMMGNHRFVSVDANGVAKEFGIAGLQLDKVGNAPESYNLHIWFEGVRELRDYEVRNLVVEVTVGSDVYRFWSRDTRHGGYHLRHWRDINGDLEGNNPLHANETPMLWELDQTLPVRILDGRNAPHTSMGMVQPPLTAEFSDVPESHDGSTAFTVRLAFSDDVDIEPAEMRDHALQVIGGTLTDAARVDGRSDLWELTLEPAGTADIGILVPPGRACTEQGALCTADGLSLSGTVPGLLIPYPQTQSPGLTAEFRNVPPEHDGSNGFTFRLAFSEAPEVTFRTLRDQALSASGGTVQRVRRVVQGENDLWEIRVEPSGNGDVTVTLGPSPACGEPGAICTPGGTPLSGTATATVEGPSLPALSIADAEAQEGPNAFLRFEITLSEASGDPVTFDIATSDGTAIAGTDYVAKTRSKTIAAGSTTAWFRINVIDDAIDEGDETFTVTISNVTGATIADGTAIGTIENSDAMPRAWLARFGRTVADQVLDAVEGRMAAARAPGTEVAVAGQRLGGEAPEAGALERREAEARIEALAGWLRGDEDDDRDAAIGSRGATGRELLTGSSFSLTGGSADRGFGAFWGRVAASGFDGREDDLTLDGEVTSGMLGADWTVGRGSAGLILSHSRGEGGYRSGAGGGEVESTLTGIYPWGRYRVSERLTAWGLVGYGAGTLTLTPEEASPIETDMDLAMAALGGRGVLAEAPAGGGLEVAATSDAMVVRTTSEEVRGGRGSMAASEADVSRLRLGLEGTWRGLGTVVPTLEIGARHDGGDAETGFGADIGARLVWADPSLGIRAEFAARGLLTHEDGSMSDRGFSGSLAWDPSPDTDRGARLTLSQAVGSEATGGMDALLRPDTARELAANDDAPDRRTLEARLGYGIAMFGDRWTGIPEVGLGLTEASREYIHAWRLVEERASGLAFGLDLEGRRRERVAGDRAAGHRIGLGAGWRLVGATRRDLELRIEGSRLLPANDNPEDRIGVRLTARW